MSSLLKAAKAAKALVIPKVQRRCFGLSVPASRKETKNIAKIQENRVSLIGAVQEDVSILTYVPELHLQHRRVRIFQPAKNAMQSGTANINLWLIEWDAWERWENPLMGWTSSGDPLSNTQVEFHSLEDAIAFCERNKWTYDVDTPQRMRKFVKNYGDNFSWDRRTRSSCK